MSSLTPINQNNLLPLSISTTINYPPQTKNTHNIQHPKIHPSKQQQNTQPQSKKQNNKTITQQKQRYNKIKTNMNSNTAVKKQEKNKIYQSSYQKYRKMNSTTHCDINNNNKDNKDKDKDNQNNNNNNKDNQNLSKGNKPIIQMNSTKTKLTYHPQQKQKIIKNNDINKRIKTHTNNNNNNTNTEQNKKKKQQNITKTQQEQPILQVKQNNKKQQQEKIKNIKQQQQQQVTIVNPIKSIQDNKNKHDINYSIINYLHQTNNSQYIPIHNTNTNNNYTDRDRDRQSQFKINSNTMYNKYNSQYKMKKYHYLQNNINQQIQPIPIQNQYLISHTQYINNMKKVINNQQQTNYKHHNNQPTTKYQFFKQQPNHIYQSKPTQAQQNNNTQSIHLNYHYSHNPTIGYKPQYITSTTRLQSNSKNNHNIHLISKQYQQSVKYPCKKQYAQKGYKDYTRSIERIRYKNQQYNRQICIDNKYKKYPGLQYQKSRQHRFNYLSQTNKFKQYQQYKYIGRSRSRSRQRSIQYNSKDKILGINRKKQQRYRQKGLQRLIQTQVLRKQCKPKDYLYKNKQILGLCKDGSTSIQRIQRTYSKENLGLRDRSRSRERQIVRQIRNQRQRSRQRQRQRNFIQRPTIKQNQLTKHQYLSKQKYLYLQNPKQLQNLSKKIHHLQTNQPNPSLVLSTQHHQKSSIQNPLINQFNPNPNHNPNPNPNSIHQQCQCNSYKCTCQQISNSLNTSRLDRINNKLQNYISQNINKNIQNKSNNGWNKNNKRQY